MLNQSLSHVDRHRLADILFPLNSTCPEGRLVALYIDTVHRKRYQLFTQPTSSKVDYERFVRDKVYTTLLEPVQGVMTRMGRDWEAMTDVWRALKVAGHDWAPLVAVTEVALCENLDEGAWSVAVLVDADMPSLMDAAIQVG